MSLRTSRWILRLLLLPFLLPYFILPVSLAIYTFPLPPMLFPPYPVFLGNTVLLLIGIAAAVPGIIFYAIWDGHRTATHIADRRRRNRQASWNRASLADDPV